MSIRNMMIGGAGATAPDAPTIGTATAGDASASVTFSAPANNGGSAITGFTVTASPGGATGSGGSSPITVSGLSNGTAYTFTVTATNAIGTGAASAASNSVTPVAPFNVAFEPTASFRSSHTGPTLGDMQTAYSGTPVSSTLALWNSTQGFLMYNTPTTGTYRITVRGARGGKDLRKTAPTQQYGRGQIIRGDVSLTAGDKVVVLCGAAPLHINTNSGDGNSGAPGGGASFVALTTSNSSSGALIPLIVSAGGAGGNAYQSNQALYDGQSYTNISARLACRPGGFTDEGGGRAGAGGGGSGWSNNAKRDDAGTASSSGTPAKALNSTALGGVVDGEDTSGGGRFGGFGGGGYAFSNDLSAGGGGYYGGFEHQGATGYWGGGSFAGSDSSPIPNATSYVNTGLVSNYGDSVTYGYNDTYGSVTIERI